MSEIEKIRERAQRANQLVVSRDDTPALGMTTRTYAADVAYLLERIGGLEAENKMAKALLGDVLYGGYGAHYGWEDAHDWLIANSAEYAANFRDPTDKEIGADV